jgi:hypothetical protein
MNAFIGDFWRAKVHFVFGDDSLYECIFLIFWFQFINVFLGENCIRIYLVYVDVAFLVLNTLIRLIFK